MDPVCGFVEERGFDIKLIPRTSASTSFIHQPSQIYGACLSPGSWSGRNEPPSWLRQRFQLSHLLLIAFLACCLPLTSASSSLYNDIDAQMVDVDVASTSELLKSSLDRLARTGTLLVDHSAEPNRWDDTNTNADNELRRRQVFGNAEESKNSQNAKTTTSATKASASKTASGGGIPVATQQTASQLPSPYDQGFNGNITESCSNFVNGFLMNSTFQACLPFSLLLLNSNSFFEVTKSVLHITQTLDATCSADTTVCNPLMASLAANISASANCASDLLKRNPLIQQAELGLKAYKPLYSASCLRNPQTSSYCYADAITNSTSPNDPYIYFLPLNFTLPGGKQPTCNACLKGSMAIFSAASSDRKSAIANTYLSAAQQINLRCGPGFVNSSLAAEVKSGASTVAPGSIFSSVGIFSLLMLVGSWLL